MKKLLCVALAAVMLAVTCLSVGAAGLDELLKDYAGITYDGQSEDQRELFIQTQAEIERILKEYWGDFYGVLEYNSQYVTYAIYLDYHGIDWKTDGVVDEAAMTRLNELVSGKQAEIEAWYISEYLGRPLYEEDVILVAFDDPTPLPELGPEDFLYLDVEYVRIIMNNVKHPIIKIKLNPKEGGRDIYEEIETLIKNCERPILSAEPNYTTLVYNAGSGSGDAGKMPFDDVKPGRYYSEAVAVLYDMGIIKGIGQNKFAPEQVTTRAMMTEILYRIDTMFGKVSVDASKPEGYEPFTDVEGKWYSGSADWARLTGVVKGYPDGTFRGDRPITRAEAATILYRYLKYAGLNPGGENNTGSMHFTDENEIPSWAKEAVENLFSKGMMVGVSAERFDPNGKMSRAMIATVAYRVVCEYQKAENQG